MDETTAQVLYTALATFERKIEVMKIIKNKSEWLKQDGYPPHTSSTPLY